MIWNLGSINADRFYQLSHLPGPGETVAATDLKEGLGGKGANMSVAAARAAAHVMHIGAVGKDGAWAIERLLEYGVGTHYIQQVSSPTGHANIHVDAKGENNIVLFPGANATISQAQIGTALTEAGTHDFLLMQNETNGQRFAAETAKKLGLRVAYAAAPFSATEVSRNAENIDLLFLNEIEAAQLVSEMNVALGDLPIDDIIVTLGADGCKWVSNKGKSEHHFDAYPADAIDSTGAGDTFTGYVLAGLDRGFEMKDAIDLGMKAGALMVARHGTADVIPDLKEIQDHDFS